MFQGCLDLPWEASPGMQVSHCWILATRSAQNSGTQALGCLGFASSRGSSSGNGVSVGPFCVWDQVRTAQLAGSGLPLGVENKAHMGSRFT